MNGKPVVRFDGTQSLLANDSTTLDITPQITIFVVAKPRIIDTNHRRLINKGHSSWTEPYYMYSLWNYSSHIGFGVSTDGTRRWTTFDGGIEGGTAYIFGGVYNQTSLYYYIDGVSKGTLNETRAMDTNNEPLQIGSTQDAAGNTWFDGDIAEIIIYDVALSDSDRGSVEQYLGEKWLGWDPLVPVTNGLVLQLDANAIEGLSDNDSIAQWDDLSGNDNHATQSTESYKPLYKTNILNGKPVVRFDGGDDLFNIGDSTSLSSIDEISVFAVITIETNQDTAIIRTPYSGVSLAWGLDYYTGKLRWFLYDSGTPYVAEDTWNISLGTTYLLSATYNGTSLISYIDQSLFKSFDHTGAIDNTNDGIRIGGRSGTPSLWLHGDIAEILVYSRALSSVERGSVEQYLGEKWLGW